MNINEYLQKCDFVGEENYLYHKGQKSQKTAIGGLLTILLISAVLATTWILGKDIIYKKEPNILIQTLLKPSRPIIKLDTSSFPISAALTDYDNLVVRDETIFHYSIASIYINNENATVITTEYPLVLCKPTHFPNFSEEVFTNTGMQNHHCIDNQNITIYGYWDEKEMMYAIIRLQKCQGKSYCKSDKEIKNFIISKSLYWNLFTQDTVVDLSDYNQPVKKYIKNIYKGINPSVSKVHDTYLRQSSVITDSGILFVDNSIESNLSIGSTDLDFSTLDNEQGIFFEFNIYSSNETVTYWRKYIKIQEVAANLGGIIKFLLVLSYLISHQFTNILRNVDILNIIIQSRANYRNNLLPIMDKDNKVKNDLKEKNNSEFKNICVIDNNKKTDKKSNDFITLKAKLKNNDLVIKTFKNDIIEESKIIVKGIEELSYDNKPNLICVENNKEKYISNKITNCKNLEIEEADLKLSSIEFTATEMIKLLVAKLFCQKIVICDNYYFKLKREYYNKNKHFVKKTLDILNIIKSSSLNSFFDRNFE